MVHNQTPKSKTGLIIASVLAGALALGAVAFGLSRIVPTSPAAPMEAMEEEVFEVAPANLPKISLAPTIVGGPITRTSPALIRIDLEATEIESELAPGVSYTYYTYGDHVPGPFVRVRLGDSVEVHLKNAKTNVMPHSVDFHAATGYGGGGAASQAAPGEEKIFTFKANHPGLFVYHCASPMPAMHIANGQYGLILVEPEGGLPKVDHEFYVMQGEIYSTGAYGTEGRMTLDTQKLLDEKPEYYVFNGSTTALTEQNPLKAKVGETIRIFFGVGGPDKISTFHVIGEVFDTVYDQASLSNPLTDTQSAITGPGSASIVELKLEYPGKFLLVDHALSRAMRGLVGHLVVEGVEDKSIFNVKTPITSTGGH